MSLVHVLSIGFALAACVMPVLLLLRRPVSPPPAIVRNAWISSSLRMSVLVALFALGAMGDVWAALAASGGFGLGVAVLGIVSRRDIAQRMIAEGGPSAFVAARDAGSSVRLVAALIGAMALFGLVGAEAAALVIVLTPLVGDGAGTALFLALVGLGGLYGVAAGPDRVLYASQALLGAILIGMFGSAVFLLYLNASDLRPMPPHGAFALLAMAASCIAILLYRQTKYVETPMLALPEEQSRRRRALGLRARWLQRTANVVVSVLAVVVVVIVAMQLYFLGVPDVLRGAVEAFATAPRVPVIGCAAIAILAASYPLVDAMSRQSADALGGYAIAARTGLARRSVRVVAVETALLGIFMAGFGAIAALSTDLPADTLGMADFVRQLVVFDHEITDAALTLLLVACFAMAAATMGMAVSTAVTIIRLDVAPALPDAPSPSAEHRSRGAAAAMLTASAAIWIAAGVPATGAADARFFGVALAFVCLQLSLLPLVLARMFRLELPAGGALLTICAAAAALGGCIAAYGVTADQVWLWRAVPTCIAAGSLILGVATLLGRVGAARSS